MCKSALRSWLFLNGFDFNEKTPVNAELIKGRCYLKNAEKH